MSTEEYDQAEADIMDLDLATATLDELKEYVSHVRDNGGGACPTCEQQARNWKNTLDATQALSLLSLWDAGADTKFVSISEAIHASGRKQAHREAQARHWGLIVPASRTAPKGQRNKWMLTELGVAFIHGTAAVPRFAITYNKKLLRLEGPAIDIHEALGERWDKSVMMRRNKVVPAVVDAG